MGGAAAAAASSVNVLPISAVMYMEVDVIGAVTLREIFKNYAGSELTLTGVYHDLQIRTALVLMMCIW